MFVRLEKGSFVTFRIFVLALIKMNKFLTARKEVPSISIQQPGIGCFIYINILQLRFDSIDISGANLRAQHTPKGVRFQRTFRLGVRKFEDLSIGLI